MRLEAAWASSVLFGCWVGAFGQAQVTFSFDRAGMETPRYTIAVGEDRKAKYHAETGAAKGAAVLVDRELSLGGKTTGTIFELARAADRFGGECASKAKNIADTGKKTLGYTGPDGSGQCTFNYSENKPVMALADLFLQMEVTLEAGRRMDFKRRFDRLGLDQEMITLASMLESHQATAIETIAPTLQAIASDTELLARVRSRAEKMLRMADANR